MKYFTKRRTIVVRTMPRTNVEWISFNDFRSNNKQTREIYPRPNKIQYRIE